MLRRLKRSWLRAEEPKTSVVRGIGRMYYCFDYSDRERKVNPFLNLSRRMRTWKDCFKVSGAEEAPRFVPPSLSSPIDTTTRTRKHVQRDLYADTYIDFMASEQEDMGHVSPSEISQKKKSMTHGTQRKRYRWLW